MGWWRSLLRTATVPTQKFKRPIRHHLDRRAGQLLTHVTTATTADDGLLSTQRVAELLGVSEQWLEVGRIKGYGPPFIPLAPRFIRYKRSDVIKWLKRRRMAAP
jgi:predicted DNA-binding transcriptional regulator AlpA